MKHLNLDVYDGYIDENDCYSCSEYDLEDTYDGWDDLSYYNYDKNRDE